MDRRQSLKLLAGASLAWTLAPQASFGANLSERKCVWIMLRGALDSLHALVPNDSQMTQLRPELYSAIKDQLLPLDKRFGLHPELTQLHQWYLQGSLLPVVAVASSVGQRSHFVAQDTLEAGSLNERSSGWLGRACELASQSAVAISPVLPLSLSAQQAFDTWYPQRGANASEDLLARLSNMYQQDPRLHSALEQALSAEQAIETAQNRKATSFVELARATGQLLTQPGGANAAVLNLPGWDTHNRQVNRLARQLALLDQGLAALKQSLGDQWHNSLVIIASEFGRTVAQNGTAGTDHGTAGCLFLAGGAVHGGQVLGGWPGLAAEQLYQGRDLAATSNSFAWIAAALGQHWQLSKGQLARVFPEANAVDQQIIRPS